MYALPILSFSTIIYYLLLLEFLYTDTHNFPLHYLLRLEFTHILLNILLTIFYHEFLLFWKGIIYFLLKIEEKKGRWVVTSGPHIYQPQPHLNEWVNIFHSLILCSSSSHPYVRSSKVGPTYPPPNRPLNHILLCFLLPPRLLFLFTTIIKNV